MTKKYKINFLNHWKTKKISINIVPSLQIRKLDVESDKVTLKETPGLTISWLGFGLDISGIPYYFKKQKS